MSTVTHEQIFDKVCELLAPYNPKNLVITRQSGIVTDLEVDSTAVFDLIMGIEDHYDISIPMEMVSDIKTVGELGNVVMQLISEA
ncbi:MAG TPA: acyl carrier protein [Hellea balneolensis]|uniref:Acyl carrier protein n=1 Tax=Hellea balneolensis TaxID=287478 RepID=A0A7C5M0S1_9PROT|nr:acyl carrier protein [Hellea balneolensis]